MLKNGGQIVGYLLALLLLYYLLKPFIETQRTLNDIHIQILWQWVVLSFFLQLLYRTLYILPFAKVLQTLTQKPVPLRNAFTLFHLANITRYLPGRIWGVVRLLSLSKRFGLSRTDTARGLTLHVGIETALGGLLALSLLFSKQMRDTALTVLGSPSGHALLLTVSVVCVIGGILFGMPQIAPHAKRFIKTFGPLLKNRQLLGFLLNSHCFLWFCQGLALFLFVRSFASLNWSDAGVLIACYAFAWLIGFLSFLTPGGLGIREGLLGLLLAHYMPAPKAAFVAVLCRLWMLSSEIVLAGIAYCLSAQTRRSLIPFLANRAE